jgi:hypothetical protein
VIGAAGSRGIRSERQPTAELSRDPRFERRVRRLAVVSAVALGLIWGLAVTTLEAPQWVDALFAAGWLLMPLTLAGSISWPRVRYALVLPASLVSVALLSVCLRWLPAAPAAAAGWVLLTAGVMLGGGLGFWFWYRLLPVPARLDDPFSTGRWALVATHIALVIVGFGLAASSILDR